MLGNPDGQGRLIMLELKLTKDYLRRLNYAYQTHGLSGAVQYEATTTVKSVAYRLMRVLLSIDRALDGASLYDSEPELLKVEHEKLFRTAQD